MTAGICMKVRFKSKVTRGFTFSPLRDSRSRFAALVLSSHAKKNQDWKGKIKTKSKTKMIYIANKEYVTISNDLLLLLPLQFFPSPVNPDGQMPQLIVKWFSVQDTLG